MDHVVLPLDRDHQRAVARVVDRLAPATGLPPPPGTRAHVTLVAHRGLDRAAVWAALEPVAEQTRPFTVHAHGYGLFTGPDPADLSLHVPVVRTEALDHLHEQVVAALQRAGAEVAGWSEAARWTPHVTLLAHDLTPAMLSDAVGLLIGRRHPSWQIPLDRLEVTGGWPDRADTGDVHRFGGS